ncbi:metallophosphoesterase family protein [Lewinella sp. IMCC34183]|uniref:metallophosphoesterase family protein n=1 Tax=Lewinella sp. IMCC34183 TaxID=2248762 RepID=UPI000E277542|nr:metallophosphoesterase family protein [Lewinella sp. IMCC34183]
MPRYAITDIHGCARTFAALLERIGYGREDELFLLGDYIDRGPDSAGVLRRIWRLQGQGHRIVCLRGNHEQMLLDAHARGHTPWDYQPEALELQQTLHWIEHLPYYHETPGYVLVHAGLNLGLADPLSDTQAMLWIRDWEREVTYEWLADRILVYGHTPRPVREVRRAADLLPGRPLICLDSGCAMQAPGMGHLAALNLDTREVTFIERQD